MSNEATSEPTTLTRLFGGFVLFLLIVVASSGLLLTLHYEPSTTPTHDGSPNATVSRAWQSVELRIMKQVEFGAIVREIHSIGVGLLIASLVCLLVSIVASRSRSGTMGRVWRTAVVLMMLLLGSAFTGSILPWNLRSFAAAEVVAGFLENALPEVGPWSASILRGGETVGEATLSRAYAFHIAWLPIAILLVSTALWRTKGAQGEPSSVRVDLLLGGAGLLAIIVAFVVEEESAPRSPLLLFPIVMVAAAVTHLLLSAVHPAVGKRRSAEIWGHLLGWLVMFGLLVTLAAVAQPERIAPVEIGKPTLHSEGVHPEWYLMFGYGALRSLSSGVAFVLLTGLALLMLLSPSLEERFGGGRIFRMVGVVSLLGLLGLAVWGYFLLW